MAEFLSRVAERGDMEAFRKLFQAYAPRVKAYIRGREIRVLAPA